MIFQAKIKGESEEALKALGFERVSIYRPGLIMTNRPKPEGFHFGRKMERLANGIAKVSTTV